MTQLLTSSFDFGGLTVDFDQTVDFDRRLTFQSRFSLPSFSRRAPHPLNIHIANGSTMYGNSLGFVSTSSLSVPRVFYVPDLSYNLCSVGQLAELGYRLIFYYSGYIMQDPRTR